MLGIELMFLINEPPRRNPPLSRLEIFMLGLLLGIYFLDTAINGNFLEAPIWESLNVIENLVGNLPVASIQEDITLAHIMRKLEKIELEIPSITSINELDRKIQGNLNRLDSSMLKMIKT